MDPHKNQLVHYSKLLIGRKIKASKVRVTMEFIVNEVAHTFVVIHSVMRGRYAIYLDGMYKLFLSLLCHVHHL